MAEPITYTVTFEEGGWTARDHSKRVRGVAVAGNLTQLERELEEAHEWAWPEDTPAVKLILDLPGDLTAKVEAWRDERKLAELHAARSLTMGEEVVAELTARWSEPDTARITGLSKQRVHQLKRSHQSRSKAEA
ncbi:hypothetical protein ACIBEJ_09180 [Nonomuraea sp. NPDC050790]|uniref:hypothetical protein n=1 Tax=Nonomuraea sp. NPDC050790 TaxID=3364371 RepID=UPI0037A7DD90